jgi:hypothetical protein
MRGTNTLFGLFVEKDKAPKPDDYRARNHYKPERDLCLAYRFFYYANIQRMRYDDALKQLEREFFLTEHRLVVVMAENQKKLAEIIEHNPTPAQLAKLYPHLVWNPKKN